jgi:hypothetical protein
MYQRDSRYAGLPTRIWPSSDGVEIAYTVASRPIPPPAIGASLRVGSSDRPDLIAWRTLGKPTLFWQVADANDAIDPFDLVRPAGRIIRLPEQG